MIDNQADSPLKEALHLLVPPTPARFVAQSVDVHMQHK